MKGKIYLLSIVWALALMLALLPRVLAQTASEPGHAAADTGKNAVHETTHTFHAMVDDPVLTDKAKSALSNDRKTMNQPILISVKGGVVILKGQVPSRAIAEHAGNVVADIHGVKSVENDLIYPGSVSARADMPRARGDLPPAQPPYAKTAPAEQVPPAAR